MKNEITFFLLSHPINLVVIVTFSPTAVRGRINRFCSYLDFYNIFKGLIKFSRFKEQNFGDVVTQRKRGVWLGMSLSCVTLVCGSVSPRTQTTRCHNFPSAFFQPFIKRSAAVERKQSFSIVCFCN